MQEDGMEQLLTTIVGDRETHLRWLATLSHLENCGARKIMRFQDFAERRFDVLQHAAEEARHALFMRRLMGQVSPGAHHRADLALLGGSLGRRYLHRLDARISRELKEVFAGEPKAIKRGAYLLTTYAIEKRAESLYPQYERALKAAGMALSLKSLIREEENHLRHIEAELAQDSSLQALREPVRGWESALFKTWRASLAEELGVVGVHRCVGPFCHGQAVVRSTEAD